MRVSVLSFDVTEKPLNPNLSFQDISFLTLEAVIQVLLICLAGYVAARTNRLTKAGQKAFSAINVDVLTPCLAFIKLAPLLSLNKMDHLFIPIFYCFATFISCVCARVISRIARLNGPETDFVTAMGVFGNSNSLPVSLTVTLAYTLPDLSWDQIADDNPDKVASRGIMYLLLFQQLGQILRWSWGYNHLLRKRTMEELLQYNDEPVTYRRIESMDALYLGSAALPEPTDASETSLSDESVMLDRRRSSSVICSAVEFAKFYTCAILSWSPVRCFMSFMNPPLYAMLLSLIVGSVQLLKALFFDNDSFVKNTVTKAILELGSVSIPLILMVLGSNLKPSDDNPPPSRHYTRIIIASLLSRMIIPAVVLLPLIAICVKYIKNSLLADPIFLLVAFILTVSPPAIQLTQITQLNGIYEREMAGIMFWGYAVLTLPTTIFIVSASLEVLKWAR